ncbi:MAG: hypothetical protein K5695_11060 [Oscillospiraceae bacterium]|nr:hypothetical protein [Oscillospiraceae bacterium]
MKKMQKAIACLLSFLMLTGGIAVETTAAETTDAREAVVLDEAELIPVLITVQLSAENAKALYELQQETAALTAQNEAKAEAIRDQADQAEDDATYAAAMQEADAPILEILAKREALRVAANAAAEGELQNKLAPIGAVMLFIGVYPEAGIYAACGKLTYAQIEALRSDPDVVSVEEQAPIDPEATEPEPDLVIEPQPQVELLVGDLNADGAVNVLDVICLQKHLLNMATLSEDQWACADLNADGCVDVFDLGLLKREVLTS